MAVLNARESFSFKSSVESDCAPLNHFIRKILDGTRTVRFMRDPTRGGVATVLNELAGKTSFGIEIDESELPVSESVRAMCEILGFDPLYIANEGKVLMVISEHECDKVKGLMKKEQLGRYSAAIGRFVKDHPGKVVLKSTSGGKRIIGALTGEQLPRIC